MDEDQKYVPVKTLPPDAQGNDMARFIFTGPVWDTWGDKLFFCIHGELLSASCEICENQLRPWNQLSPEMLELDNRPLELYEAQRLLAAIFHATDLQTTAPRTPMPEVPQETSRLLYQTLLTIPKRNRIALRLLIRGKTPKEIANTLGCVKDLTIPISPQRVYDIVRKATRLLRHPNRVKVVLESLPKEQWLEYIGKQWWRR
jgi:DNA-binding CsgD family transcriptional regulator